MSTERIQRLDSIKQSAQEVQSALTHGKTGDVLKILVIEDDAEDRFHYSRLFKEFNVEVTYCNDAKCGIAELEKRNVYHLIIIDFKLEYTGAGIDVLREAKKTHKGIPVVIASGQLPEFRGIRGPIIIIPKPMSLEDLQEMVVQFKLLGGI